MCVPILTTKLHIPRLRPDLVPRPDLLQCLDEGLRLGHRLTLVSAPAGFGKTTLLSVWAAAHSLPKSSPDARVGSSQTSSLSQSETNVAWLTLDRGDNDLARFLAYLLAACGQVEPQGSGTFATLRPPPPLAPDLYAAGLFAEATLPAIEALMTTLVNQIGARPCNSILILDDYQTINSQSIHGAVTFLLDHLPENMHLAIATRADPPLPVARLRGRQQLTELRQADLRFTLDETAVLLEQTIGLQLSREAVRALVSRTEGWIAALQIAAVSFQGHDADQISEDIRTFTGSHRHIVDYLVEEVLDRQPEPIQAFLLQTSILDRLNGPLCDAILGMGAAAHHFQRDPKEPPTLSTQLPTSHFQPPTSSLQSSSQELLEYLDAANLFVVPLDDERRWYRYHHLLADLLRQRLKQAPADRVSVLHRRASVWYEQNELIVEAVDHALAAGDLGRVASLLDRHAEALWAQEAHGALSRWIGELPDSLVARRPKLCIFQGMMLSMAGQYSQAELRLQAAEQALQQKGGTSPSQRGRVAAIRAMTAYFQGEIPAIIRFARQALDLLPPSDTAWRSSAALNLGDAHRWLGDMVAANQAYEEALAAGRASGNAFVLLLARVKQIIIEMLRGRLRQAFEMCDQLSQLAETQGWAQASIVGAVYQVQGSILYEWNHLDQALECLQEACRLCEQGHSAGLTGMSYLALLRTLATRQDTASMAQTTERLERLVHESRVPIWIASAFAAWQIGRFIKQGDLPAAEQFLQVRRVALADEIHYPREIEYLSLARLLIAQGTGQPDYPYLRQALGLLDRLLQPAEAGGRMAWVLLILLLRAQALDACGDTEQALAVLARALSLAEPQGYLRTFVDEGLPMARLLRQAAAQGVIPDYVNYLLTAFDGDSRAQDRKAAHTPPSFNLHPPTLVEPLSSREFEVLQLLATPLSTNEIADRLFISIHTVRSHLRSIYGKLDVHSRYQTVARAQELHLL